MTNTHQSCQHCPQYGQNVFLKLVASSIWLFSVFAIISNMRYYYLKITNLIGILKGRVIIRSAGIPILHGGSSRLPSCHMHGTGSRQTDPQFQTTRHHTGWFLSLHSKRGCGPPD